MQVQIIEQPSYDAAWDNFLLGQSSGHHVQSSMWGQLKVRFGWDVIRILVWEADKIVGGTQILMRSLPIWGRIGYISKGPVVPSARTDVIEILFDHIEQVAKKQHLLVLSIQPPEDDAIYMSPIKLREFKPSSFYVVPPTTVIVDLQPNEDEILQSMQQKTRYNIRLAARKNVVVREGDEKDLEIFYKLTQITGERNEVYTYYDLAYYQEVWRQFAPGGFMKLFLAYYKDEPLGALIAIAFGKWAVYKWGASSNNQRHRMPNNLLQWTAMRWSKAQGCRWYDLGGITPPVAAQLKEGKQLVSISGAGTARFKLGFGQVVTFPDSYDNNYGIRPRWLIRKSVEVIWKFRFLRGLIRGATGS